MEARKTLTLLLAALALTACKYDDSELWEQVNRNTEHYTGIKVDFGDTQRLFMTCGETMAVDFTAEGSDRFTTDNLFTVAPYGWKAEVTLPTRAATGFILNVTAPADAASGAVEGDILVMLDNAQGSTTIGQLTVAACSLTGTELKAGGVQPGELATAIGDRTDLTSVTVTSGTLNETDWAAVKQSKRTLQTIDLEGATYTGADSNNWIYKDDRAIVYGNATLITVKLPQGITGLGYRAFIACFSLTSIILQEGLTSIGDSAFAGCKALTTVTLPEGLTSIGAYAFENCTSLTTVTCLSPAPPELRDNTFSGCSALTAIYVPAGSVEAYQAATGWSDYADIIQTIP